MGPKKAVAGEGAARSTAHEQQTNEVGEAIYTYISQSLGDNVLILAPWGRTWAWVEPTKAAAGVGELHSKEHVPPPSEAAGAVSDIKL